MKRMFIAGKISSDLTNKILRYQAQHQYFPQAWIHAKNLHITLIPPFNAKNEKIQNIKTILEKITKESPSLSFVCTNIELNNTENPRVLWLSLEKNKGLEELKQSIEKSLLISPDSRPFHPHITVGRIRTQNAHFFSKYWKQEKIKWTNILDTIVIMESHLRSDGADYDIVYSFPLQKILTS